MKEFLATCRLVNTTQSFESKKMKRSVVKHILLWVILHKKRKNHSTVLKKICNPLLRKLGWSIVSVFENSTFVKYQFRKYPENCKKNGI